MRINGHNAFINKIVDIPSATRLENDYLMAFFEGPKSAHVLIGWEQ